MELTTLLLFAKDVGASDLHLSAQAPLMVRKNGEMRKLALPGVPRATVLTPYEARRLVYEVLTDNQKKTLENDKELDFALTIGSDARFRGNVFLQSRGVSGVFRVVAGDIPSLDDLNLPASIREFTKLEQGLVLVTGPTGSGKSTTLAAMIDSINRERRGHILTIEDPIEFVHQPKGCMVNQRELGPHARSFSSALRGALREDPDVILVGEMRDLETISLAITAAETGHLVFATLHTRSAAKTVDRIVNVFPAHEQSQIRSMFADSLAGIVSQLLLPRSDGGRVAALEVLVATTGVRAMIRDDKTHQILSAIQTGQRYGMQGLEQALMDLTLSGVVEREVADHYLRVMGRSRDDETAPHAPGGQIASARQAPQEGGATATRRVNRYQRTA